MSVSQVLHHEDVNTDLGDTRDLIYSYFDKVFCFLLPHPGLNVAEDKNLNGCHRGWCSIICVVFMLISSSLANVSYLISQVVQGSFDIELTKMTEQAKCTIA